MMESVSHKESNRMNSDKILVSLVQVIESFAKEIGVPSLVEITFEEVLRRARELRTVEASVAVMKRSYELLVEASKGNLEEITLLRLQLAEAKHQIDLMTARPAKEYSFLEVLRTVSKDHLIRPINWLGTGYGFKIDPKEILSFRPKGIDQQILLTLSDFQANWEIVWPETLASESRGRFTRSDYA